MTATTASPSSTTIAQSNHSTRNRVLKVGALIGAGLIYVAAIGLLATFNHRLIVDPILSLGYVVLFGVPFAAGLSIIKREKLEGVEPEPVSIRDVGMAAAAGAFGGVMAAVFALLIDQFPEVR